MKEKKNLVIGLSIVAGALVLVLGALLVVFFIVNNKASVNMNLVIQNYSNSNCTRIPVNVVGKDFDETTFIDEHGEGLQLKNGEYEFTFPASPLCANGTFWEAPSNFYKMTIKDGKIEDFDNNKIEFALADLATVTDVQIDTANAYARHDEESDKDIEQYVKATKEARDKAKAEAEKASRFNRFKDGFITADYAFKDDPNVIFHLDMENRKFSITKNGSVITKGSVCTKGRDGHFSPSEIYGVDYLVVSAPGAEGYILTKTDKGFSIQPGYGINGDELVPPYDSGDYILI